MGGRDDKNYVVFLTKAANEAISDPMTAKLVWSCQQDPSILLLGKIDIELDNRSPASRLDDL